MILRLLQRYPVVFWDFDGVIKDSVSVKTTAFVRLFEPFGSNLAERIRSHHEQHGGVSRYEKIPLYLRWAGCEASSDEIARYCELFSSAVKHAVIESPWVAGAREYLLANYGRQYFVLVTATPQSEMLAILDELRIAACFREVHGAPTAKPAAIQAVLVRRECPRNDALLVGDSASDSAAAEVTGIAFLLRRTALNQDLQRTHKGFQCEDFTDG